MTPSTTTLHGDITDVRGIRVGHATDRIAATGVTVILVPPEGAEAGLHKGGSAPSTRQMDSLSPAHPVNRVHALCLCGGSAFGLDAAGGVLAYLAEQGIGFEVVGQTVPIVPTAAIFDLNLGDGSRRPDAAMGRQACVNASSGPIEQGSVGAGTGAGVGKVFGIQQGMKGGLGSASVRSGDLIVGALVVVNAYGDVTDEEGRLLAGARVSPNSMELADAARLLREGKARSRRISVQNTTLAVVAFNAGADKVAAARIAAQATLGIGRVIAPYHTQVDGDLTIALSVGGEDADPNRIGLLASDVVRKAAINAVQRADGLGFIPAWKDLQD